MNRAAGCFELQGLQGYLRVHVEEVFGFPGQTSPFGGYDVRGSIEIKSGGFSACGHLWFATGEVYTFYQQLKRAYEEFSGEAIFTSTDHLLEFKSTLNQQGHVHCNGFYKEHADSANELVFEFRSDQTFIDSTLGELEKFVQQYGGLTGITVKEWNK